MSRSGRRGEGYVEYAVITCLIMVCSVVGLLRAGSSTVDQIANSKALCQNCPDNRLTGDEIDRLNRALYGTSDAPRVGPRTDEENEVIRNLGERHRSTLTEKVNGGTATDEEKALLDKLTTEIANLPPAPAVDPLPKPEPSLWERWFGPVAEDSFLASLMGIFGWFGFFV